MENFLTSYNVFIIEDEKNQYEKIEQRIVELSRTLERSNDITFVITGIYCPDIHPNDFMVTFEEKPVDILFLDYELTWINEISFNGQKVMDAIAENSKNPLPFLMYTSNRFESDTAALGGITYSKKGYKFISRQVPKGLLFDTNNSQDVIDTLLHAINNVDPRIILDIIDYPFNINVYNCIADYSIRELIKKSNVSNSESEPDSPLQSSQIRLDQIVAILFMKNERHGIIHIHNNQLKLSMIRFGIKNATMDWVDEIFSEKKIHLRKGTSILYNQKFICKKMRKIVKRKQELQFIEVPNVLTTEMLSSFKRKIEKEKYTNTVPFFELFRSFYWPRNIS